MAALVYGLFNLSKGGKDSKEGQKGMKIILMFGLLWLRRFGAIITSNNTAKPCHCFLSLFCAKHREAREQWPVQLLYSSFVSPSHSKKKKKKAKH